MSKKSLFLRRITAIVWLVLLASCKRVAVSCDIAPQNIRVTCGDMHYWLL